MLLFQSSLGALELGFIALACLLTFLAEWLVLRWLGKGGWPTAAKAAGWGLAPPVVAILGSWAFVRTKFFSETLAWTMIVFLPLFLFLAVLLAAWVVKLIVQWKISGPAGALVVGLVLFNPEPPGGDAKRVTLPIQVLFPALRAAGRDDLVARFEALRAREVGDRRGSS